MKKLLFFLEDHRFAILAFLSAFLFFGGMALDSVRKNHVHCSLAWICLSWAEIAIGICLVMYSMIAKEFADRMEISESTLKELRAERLARFAESLR